MSKNFKTLLGNRIYIEIPKKGESKLFLDSNTKEDLEKEMLSKMNRLKVHSVGSGMVDSLIKEGDILLIDPKALKIAPIIPLSDTEDVMLVSPFDVIHIW